MFESLVDLDGLTDDELTMTLREASAAVNRAEAHRLAVAAEWDRRQAWAADGAYSGRCWLADQCVLSRSEAGGILRTAGVVASSPVVAAAVADGSLPVAKAEVLAAVVTARTEAAFVEAGPTILDAVGRLNVDSTRRVARWWARLADQDGPEPTDTEQPELRCTAAADGTTHLAGTLDTEGGAIFRSVLEAITDQLWRARRTDPETDRPPGHLGGRLRSAALVEMARRAAAADPTRSGARPLLTVLVDLPTLEARADRPATTDHGGIISAEDARRLACDADVARVLTDPDGAILEMGRTARTATADQWRALRLRDGGCTWPGCDRPSGWCQAHHIIWWEHDGRTDLDNLTLLCSHHHHKIHDNGWHLERLHDGSLHFTGPDGRVLTRPPPASPWPVPPPPPRLHPQDRAAILVRVRALTTPAA